MERQHRSRSVSPHSFSFSRTGLDSHVTQEGQALSPLQNNNFASPNPLPLVSYPSLSPSPCSVNHAASSSPVPQLHHAAASHPINSTPAHYSLVSPLSQINMEPTTLPILSSDITNFVNPPWSLDNFLPRQPARIDDDSDSVLSLDLNSIDGLIHPITGETAKTDLDNPYRFLERGKLTNDLMYVTANKFLGPRINWRTLAFFLHDLALSCLKTTPPAQTVLLESCQTNTLLEGARTEVRNLRLQLDTANNARDTLQKAHNSLMDDFLMTTAKANSVFASAKDLQAKHDALLSRFNELENNFKVHIGTLQETLDNKERHILHLELQLDTKAFEEQDKRDQNDNKMDNDNDNSEESYLVADLRKQLRSANDNVIRLSGENRLLTSQLADANARNDIKDTDMADGTPIPTTSQKTFSNALPSSLSSPPLQANVSKKAKNTNKANIDTARLDTEAFARALSAFRSSLPDYPSETIIELALHSSKIMPQNKPNVQPSRTLHKARISPPKKPDSFISFADMIKNGSSPSPSLPRQPQPQPQYKWREIETKTSIVKRPTTLGTRVTDLYLR